MALEIHHSAISVKDLDRSLAFYRDVLGMELVKCIDCGEGSGLGEVVGLPGCKARIAKLRCGATFLELFEYSEPRGRPLERTQADHGPSHLGLSSTDIQADYARLKQHDVHFYSPPIEYRPGVWNAYFYGPDGETCELRQAVAWEA